MAGHGPQTSWAMGKDTVHFPPQGKNSRAPCSSWEFRKTKRGGGEPANPSIRGKKGGKGVVRETNIRSGFKKDGS